MCLNPQYCIDQQINQLPCKPCINVVLAPAVKTGVYKFIQVSLVTGRSKSLLKRRFNKPKPGYPLRKLKVNPK